MAAAPLPSIFKGTGREPKCQSKIQPARAGRACACVLDVLELKRSQRNVLGSDQKLPCKAELSRAPAERFFRRKAHEVRIVVLLGDVRQNQVAGAAVEAIGTVEAIGIGKKLAHGVVRKMAGARKHALLDDPGIRPHFKHIKIVIGFENQAIGLAQMDLDKLRHIPKVRANSDLAAVGAKRKPDRIGSVVRNREGVHIDVADGKALARLNGLHTAQALAKRLGQNAPKLGHRGFGYIERGFPDTENLRKAIAMVGVFVGDQDGIEVADVRSNGGKARQGFAFSKPGVNEDAGAFGFEQCEIARTAGRKNRDAQTDGNCPLEAATGLEDLPHSATPKLSK